MRESCVQHQTPTAIDGRLAFTPSEVADIFGDDRGLIYRLIAARKIIAIKIGVGIIIPRQSLESLPRSIASMIGVECSEVHNG
jgi:hypothetical protein